MEENEFNTEQIQTDESRSKNRLKKIFTSKSFIITTFLLSVFVIVEFTTDFVEIAVGSVIELTNPFRPKAGTIWDLYKKDQSADDLVKEISSAIPDKQIKIPEITNLVQLREKLEQEGTLLISAAKFLNLYNQMPTRFSSKVISPFDLLKLTHSNKWLWTKLVKSENNINIYFFDGDKQLIMDTYPPLSVLYDVSETEREHQVSLDSLDIYKNRTFSREQFFEAFDKLSSNATKFQLINNPFQLIKWDKNIRKVGVSRYTTNNIVSIGFEVNQGIYTEIFTFEASELAAGYFIAKLNELYPELNLDFPERKYRANQYF